MYLFHCKKIYTHIFILYGFLLTWESNSMRYKKTTSSLCSLMAACRGCLVLLLNMAYSKGAVMWEKSSGVKSFCGGQRHSRNEWWETIGCIKWAIKWSTTEYIWKWKQEQLKRVDAVHRSNLKKGLDTFRSFLLYFFFFNTLSSLVNLRLTTKPAFPLLFSLLSPLLSIHLSFLPISLPCSTFLYFTKRTNKNKKDILLTLEFYNTSLMTNNEFQGQS